MLKESSPFRAGPFAANIEHRCRMIWTRQRHLSKWQDGVTSPLSRLAAHTTAPFEEPRPSFGCQLSAPVRSGKACRPDAINAPYCRIEVASANPIQARPAMMTARAARRLPCAWSPVGIVHDQQGIGSVMAAAMHNHIGNPRASAGYPGRSA